LGNPDPRPAGSDFGTGKDSVSGRLILASQPAKQHFDPFAIAGIASSLPREPKTCWPFK
jgi:hypothetical protein